MATPPVRFFVRALRQTRTRSERYRGRNGDREEREGREEEDAKMRIGSDQCSPFASHRGLRGRRSPAFGKAQNEPTAAGLPATSSRATAYKAGRCAIVRITVTTGSSVGSPPPMRGTARRRLTPVDAGLPGLTYVDRSRDLAKRTHGCLRPRLDHRADLFLLFSAKLPAGRVDVSSATFADVGIHAGVAEDLLERDD